MDRTAHAKWQGDLKSGKGLISTAGPALKDLAYSFSSRFENGSGTNPEELIAAAHAGCFSMALSAELAKVGVRTESIFTTATVHLEKELNGFSIDSIHLVTRVPSDVPNQSAFLTAAERAKENCPVSKLMRAKITLEVTQESLGAEV